MSIASRQSLWKGYPYKKLNYIEYGMIQGITASGQFNTGIKPGSNAIIDATFQAVNESSSDYPLLIASEADTYVASKFRMEILSRHSLWYSALPAHPVLYAATGNDSYKSVSSSVCLSRDKLRYVFQQPTLKFYNDAGILLDTISSNYTGEYQENIRIAYPYNGVKHRLFNLKITDPSSGNVLCNYCPAKVGEEYGVFDEVSQSFKTFTLANAIVTGA